MEESGTTGDARHRRRQSAHGKKPAGETAEARRPARATSESPSAEALKRDAVLDAAVELVEAEGLTALSMRRLAARLGVGTPTIYWHVGNRDAVLDGLVSRLIAEIDVDRPDGGNPHERLKSLAESLRRELLARPLIMDLLGRAGRSDQVFVPARDACLREVRAAGLEGADAVRVMRGLLIHVVGFVQVERSLAAYRPGGPRKGQRQGIGGLPVQPDLAEHMSELDQDDLFAFTVGRLVDASLPDRP
jgi:TetR/AcrR family transcriptional regulator, tetracycline repressor protein